MNKWTKIGIIGGVVILFIVLLYVWGGKSENDANQTEVIDSWFETFDPEDRTPYGTYVLRELLDSAGMFGNFIDLDEQIEEGLKDNPDMNDIYFFIGATNFMVDSSAQHLLNFIYDGNTAFIAARSFPYKICQEILMNTEEVFEYNNPLDSMQYLKYTHPELKSKRYTFEYIFNNEGSLKNWNTFNVDNFDDYEVDLTILGTNTKNKVNFVKLKYGEGLIYLHSIPYCFTNICMMKREGFQYAEQMLEHIPPGRVQWDRYHLEPHYDTSSGDDYGDGEERKSIIQFILDHPALTWAMFVLLAGAILYVFFKGKRMQEVITASESKENTSMRYVKTLSSLYMQQGSHSKLIKLKEKTFLNFIAERYYILTKNADAPFIEKVAIKSQISKEQIASIFNDFKELGNAYDVDDDQLIKLHQKIEYFYKNCK